MEENLLQAIIEGVGVGGTIVLVVWLLRPVLLKWLENIAAERERETERQRAERESERQLVTALNGVQTELSLSRGVNTQLNERLATVATRDDMTRAGQSMREWSREHEDSAKDRYDNLKDQLSEQSAQLEALTREIKVISIPEAVRGDITKIVLLASEISINVKRLLPPEPPEPFSKIEGGAKRQQDKDLPHAAGE